MSSLVTLENPQGDSDGTTFASSSAAKDLVNRFAALTDPDEIWRAHLSVVVGGGSGMMRFGTINGEGKLGLKDEEGRELLKETDQKGRPMIHFESVIHFFKNEELSHRYCEYTLRDICRGVESGKDDFRDASDLLNDSVSLYLVQVGHQIVSGIPLEQWSPEIEASAARLELVIKSMGLGIGPEDLSFKMKWWIIVFRVYSRAIRMDAEMYKINLILLGFLKLDLSLKINFCAGVPESEQCFKELHRPGAKSYSSDDFDKYSIVHVVLYLFEHFEEFEQGTLSLKNLLLLNNRNKERTRKKKAKEARKERAKLVWAKTRHERKEKNKLYRETQLAKAELEEARRQKNLEAYHSQRVQRYYEKVWKEQEERKLLRHKLNAPHVMSPSRKREEKIRRREQQEDSHSIWRAQKRKHRNARK